MKFNFTSRITYRNGFTLFAFIIGLTMTFLSQDYGPLEDTRIHHDHGVRILNYFKGIDNLATLSPIDDQGNYYDVNKDLDSEYHGMNGFGGFFDLLTSFLHQFFSDIGVYEFKNFINSIFGFLLFLFCGLLGKELGNWKTGMLTLLFVVLTPVMFGYSMNNPKDIPAAAFYIFSIFHVIKLLKELPKVTLKRSFFLIVNISLFTNIRIIGLMVIGYVALAVFAWWVLENYASKFKKIIKKDILLLAGKIAGICILSYIAVSLFWPYAHTNPITVPIEVLFKMAEFRGFENLQIFEGQWQSSFNMPWYFAIKNLFIITMPLHAFLGFFLIPLLYFRASKKKVLYISFILFTSVFPILLIIFGKPNSHDGSRQFMFVVLPMVVLSALAWSKLFRDYITISNFRIVIYGLLAVLLLQPIYFMVRYHPMQALYFSPIVGGVGGAFKHYEIDYYGVGIKPALDWLDENVGNENTPPKIRMYYGSQTKMTYYTDKNPGLQHVLSRRDSPAWDYSIVMQAEGKYKQDHNVNWFPENTVHEIRIDGAPICYIVKNNYQVENHVKKLEQEVAKKPSVDKYIRLGLLYYNKNELFKSVRVFKKALLIDPENSVVYNNLCSAYNRLLMYDEARDACERSLQINPKSTLTKNNLKVSLRGIDRKLTIKEYNNLSFNYYKLSYFDKCIKVSYEILEIDPNNSIAYNNICSSYNVLGDHEKAITACNKAIEIAPNFQLAKNNLEWAKEELMK